MNHRSEWKPNSWGMFFIIMCQRHSHSRPVLSLREALPKYVELSPSTPPFLTLQFHEKDLTPTPDLLRIRPILPLLGHILSRCCKVHISFQWVHMKLTPDIVVWVHLVLPVLNVCHSPLQLEGSVKTEEEKIGGLNYIKRMYMNFWKTKSIHAWAKISGTHKNIITWCIPSCFELFQDSFHENAVVWHKYIPKYDWYLIQKVTMFLVKIAFCKVLIVNISLIFHWVQK